MHRRQQLCIDPRMHVQYNQVLTPLRCPMALCKVQSDRPSAQDEVDTDVQLTAGARGAREPGVFGRTDGAETQESAGRCVTYIHAAAVHYQGRSTLSQCNCNAHAI